MTNRPGKWTRRQFSQVLAATAASSLLARTAMASIAAQRGGFAFIGSSAVGPKDGVVRVYRVSGEDWREVHAVSAASPALLVMHPSLPVLYVLHDVSEWDHRPRGAVSAYRFDGATGRLTHAGTQPLSLSATNPKNAVITARGQALFVAAKTGGIYNVLPIASDGALQRVSAIRKEFGLQDGVHARTATPSELTLASDGSVYATDPGQETVSCFAVSRDAITLQHRGRVHAGDGASHIAFSDSNHVYAMNATDGSISTHGMTAEGLSPALQVYAGAATNASLQMHPDGRLLAVSSDDCLQLLRVHLRTGQLSLSDCERQPRMQQMRFAAGGTELVGFNSSSGEIVTHALDTCAGRLNRRRVVAHARGVSSLLLHQA